ncbi:hypothetical protein [uncultured Rubinisphaera sp.]|mgnify:CR=1 FL=1|uniref:hypothetical protein n=1 Tax=uncultured Rubinisphaera sp. TaxID=1678686 RepID=UPI0030D7E416
MSKAFSYPEVNLSVAVILCEGRTLLTWNDNWGAFSLPMTKIRTWPGPSGSVDEDSESAQQAAIRAAAEGLGRPLQSSEIPDQPVELELQPYSHRSHRDGQWKRYSREVFVFELEVDLSSFSGNGVWLTPEEVSSMQPISQTAQEVLKVLKAHRG